MTNLIEKEILFDVLKSPGDTFYESVLSDFLDEQNIEHDFRKPLHNDKIIELKPHHEKYLDIWVDHWARVGLCTIPTDESKAEQYFYDFYKQLGLENPKKIIWLDNPVEMCSKISDWDYVSNQVWNRVWNQIRDQVRSQINDQVRDRVVKVQWRVYFYVNNHVVWDQMCYGQQDARWLAFFAYIMQVLRVEAPKQLVPYILLAQEVNCWLPTEQTVFVTRKPKECIVENGKFVKLVYQDGYPGWLYTNLKRIKSNAN